MCEILKADITDATIIHRLGHEAYNATYTNILTKEQIDFMLEKNYHVEALQKAMCNGEDFFILYDQHPLGFIALREKDSQILRIEKLYLLTSGQGRGLGKKMISFAIDEAINRQKSILELNVNRENKAYYFYLQQGFEDVEEVDIPYFGYILDDYVMRKAVI